jgi:hypothetical protein
MPPAEQHDISDRGLILDMRHRVYSISLSSTPQLLLYNLRFASPTGLRELSVVKHNGSQQVEEGEKP